MTRRTTASFLVVLFVSISGQAIYAQSSHTPPVLRSSGISRGEERQANTAGESQADVADGDILRVSTNLISVPAVVMDRSGRYIANLRKEDFRIYEDGVEQSIADFASVSKPFTVALLLDVSGSTQLQLSQIRQAANIFVSRLRMNDRLMAISFDGQIHLLTDPTDISIIRRSKLHMPAVTDGTVL